MRTPSSVTNLFEELTDGLAVGTTSAAQTSASSGRREGVKIKNLDLINIGSGNCKMSCLLRQLKENKFLSGLCDRSFFIWKFKEN
jgi:hypothetical protein